MRSVGDCLDNVAPEGRLTTTERRTAQSASMCHPGGTRIAAFEFIEGRHIPTGAIPNSTNFNPCSTKGRGPLRFDLKASMCSPKRVNSKVPFPKDCASAWELWLLTV